MWLCNTLYIYIYIHYTLYMYVMIMIDHEDFTAQGYTHNIYIQSPKKTKTYKRRKRYIERLLY